MTDRLLGDQAAQLTDLLPRLLRAIFALDPNDPTMDLPVAQLRVCSILCDGRRTRQDIEQELLRRFGHLFRTPGQAARFVTEVIARESR